VITKACKKSGVDPKEVDFLIFHQANLNIIEYVVRKMGYCMKNTFTNVQEIGNTGAASVGIALSEAVAKGFIMNGQLVVMAAVGAGFNFGASVWRWDMSTYKDK
jgi:3-oxoacyl-[acyl-carrier-protein] synthase-3